MFTLIPLDFLYDYCLIACSWISYIPTGTRSRVSGYTLGTRGQCPWRPLPWSIAETARRWSSTACLAWRRTSRTGWWISIWWWNLTRCESSRCTRPRLRSSPFWWSFVRIWRLSLILWLRDLERWPKVVRVVEFKFALLNHTHYMMELINAILTSLEFNNSGN